jgi:hypothetical protein
MKPQILASILLAIAPLCHAGDTVEESAPIAPAPAATSEWEFLLALYGPLMGVDGTVGAAGLTGEIDVPFDDILDNLDGSFMAALEARRGPWSVTADLFWLKLSASGLPTSNSYLGIGMEQTLATVALGYELHADERTTLDLLGGAALTSMEIDLDLFTPRLPVTNRAASGSETWIDPFFGLRLRHHLSDRWSLFATGLYGGFGVASDEYWQAIAGISYRITENSALALGYRVISTDYQDGGFVYDAKSSGPNVGLVIRF